MTAARSHPNDFSFFVHNSQARGRENVVHTSVAGWRTRTEATCNRTHCTSLQIIPQYMIASSLLKLQWWTEYEYYSHQTGYTATHNMWLESLWLVRVENDRIDRKLECTLRFVVHPHWVCHMWSSGRVIPVFFPPQYSAVHLFLAFELEPLLHAPS